MSVVQSEEHPNSPKTIRMSLTPMAPSPSRSSGQGLPEGPAFGAFGVGGDAVFGMKVVHSVKTVGDSAQTGIGQLRRVPFDVVHTTPAKGVPYAQNEVVSSRFNVEWGMEVSLFWIVVQPCQQVFPASIVAEGNAKRCGSLRRLVNTKSDTLAALSLTFTSSTQSA